MLKLISMLGGGLVLVASAALGLNFPRSQGGKALALLNPVPEVDAAFEREFCGSVLVESNAIRVGRSLESLKPDSEIQSFVAEQLGRCPDPEGIELNAVFDSLQERYPGAQFLAANLVTANSREALLRQLLEWEELSHAEFSSISTSVTGAGRKMVALSVLSRRLPRFSVAAANGGESKFYNVCPHGGRIHALEMDRKSKTVILSCPDCQRPYDVLAADSSGRMRRAIDFFTEFQLPGRSPRLTSKQKVLSIWRAVADRCRYEHDHSGFDESEVWKTSDETWFDGVGDCEDTSILLADLLISAGLDARVAIGWNGNIGQHAWVVVRIGEEQFVLESTVQDSPTMEDFLPVGEAAHFYRPEQLFNRRNLYFQNASPELVASDYFSEKTWTAIGW